MGWRATDGGIPVLKPDGAGTFYRELGWKQAEEPGEFRQHKFYLGSNVTQAREHYLRLSQVTATPVQQRVTNDIATLVYYFGKNRSQPVPGTVGVYDVVNWKLYNAVATDRRDYN